MSPAFEPTGPVRHLRGMSTTTTSVSQHVSASRAAVYRACLDADALVQWRVPDAMHGVVHLFEPRVGGRVRMSLVYDDDRDAAEAVKGKSDDDTDTSESTFIELVADRKIVESIVFESDDPRFAGTMIMTTLLEDNDVDGVVGTKVTITAEGIPEGIDPADNVEGTRQSLQKLAAMFAD